MKRQFFSTMAMLAAAGALMMTSCAKDVEEPQMDGAQPEITTRTATGPKVMVYVEINDNNPLIGLSYKLADGTQFIDILNLFASNIHKDAAGYPTLYFNDKMTRVLEPAAGDANGGFHKYIKPLQDAGIKVCLTSLGDWQGIGVANLNADQADRFADILVYAVDRYGLDGINFDDEYANYNSTVSGSYARIIKALRAKLDAKFGVGAKLITVFQWGNVSQIDAAAGAMIDYADQGSFGANVFPTSSYISGMTNDRWMPMALNLGYGYNALNLTSIKNNAAKTKNQGYGGMMCFNMRRASDVNPLPVFKKMAEGAFGSTVTYNGIDYQHDWQYVSTGYTITKDDVPAYSPKYTE